MDLVLGHEGGFFSCCSVRLYYLILFFNKYKQLPKTFDSKGFYTWYKQNTTEDITFSYFENYENINEMITYTRDINYHECYQYKKYTTLDLEKLLPIIRKYFTPTSTIQDIKTEIMQKYSLDFDNICVLFYRGNDKATEITLPSFDEYITYADEILKKQPNIKFLIQSDETNFINAMKVYYPDNHIIFNDEIRHIPRRNTTVDRTTFNESNYYYSKKYLAITLIMSKCKYIICNSGNCSIWIVFFRTNVENIIQLCAIESL